MKTTTYQTIFICLILLIVTSCGHSSFTVVDGEYVEAGFFTGVFNALFWPFSLIFMGVGQFVPYYSTTALYTHFNNGFFYWTGYIIGLLPYLMFLGAMANGSKKPTEQDATSEEDENLTEK